MKAIQTKSKECIQIELHSEIEGNLNLFNFRFVLFLLYNLLFHSILFWKFQTTLAQYSENCLFIFFMFFALYVHIIYLSIFLQNIYRQTN